MVNENTAFKKSIAGKLNSIVNYEEYMESVNDLIEKLNVDTSLDGGDSFWVGAYNDKVLPIDAVESYIKD